MRSTSIHAALVAFGAALLAAADASSPTAPVGVVILLICIARKKEAIGGWLLLFHIQNYQSLLVTLVFAFLNRRDYDPAAWSEAPHLYLWFILSVVPSILWLPVQLVVAERLRVRRARPRGPGELPEQQLRTMQRVLWVALGLALVGISVDAALFPDNLLFSGISLVPAIGWALYFQLSQRVRRVYVARDWNGTTTQPPESDALDLVPPKTSAPAHDGAPVGVPIAKRE